jgi:coenzyme F420-reducing hydrogenase gamma subunit
MVNVFEKDPAGRCIVVNDELCFGCMACVAQCAENGVSVVPREARRYPTAEELLR